MTLAEDNILENRYRIERLLAQGGMGSIYKAYDTNLEIPVAIKENYFQTPEGIQQFEQEALILARLRHPGLPRVIHHFSAQGKHYLVMDYIEGKDLWEFVKEQDQPLEEKQALDYIIQICDAVHYLHQQKPSIIHRDIKPQNIKITPDNHAVLVDFGIAKVGGEDIRTRTGAKGVTPGFSPPEQYSGMGTTPRSDIYALGATLYALLTTKKPPDSISLLVGGTKFEPPNTINPNLSPQVSEAIEHAMRIQPVDRPQTAEAWKMELQAVSAMLAATDSENEETMVSQPSPNKEATVAGAAVTTTYWLVDNNGLGYPLGTDPLVIGRNPKADVVIKVLSASREHALIKAEEGQCWVFDNHSANGTFINGQRIGAEWRPLKPGDVLAVGTTRFEVSKKKPARIAPPKPKSHLVVVDEIDRADTHPETAKHQAPVSSSPAPEAVDERPTPSIQSPHESRPSSKAGFPLIPVVAAGVVLLLAAIAGGAYLFLSSSTAAPATPTTVAQAKEASDATLTQTTTTAASPIPEADATDTSQAEITLTAQAQAQANIERTRQAEQATATPTKEESPTVEAVVRDTPTPTEETRSTQTPTITASPTSVQIAAADTPTPTQPPPTPRPSGPTAIPVETVESTAEIGNVPVTAVEINPENPTEVYALVKGNVNGIFKSINGGEGPWGRLDIDASGIIDFVIDPTTPARFFAPAWNAVIRSDDGGNSWKAFGDGLSTANRVVNVVTIDPVSPNILYGGIGETLVVSTDGGTSWTSDGFGNGLGQGRLTSITVDPFNHDVVFIGGEFGSIYKSVDTGRNFQQLAFSTGRGTYSIAANPAKRDEYLAGVNSFDAAIIKTTNAADFQSSSNGLIFGGADSAYSAIRYAPSNPSIVYTGSGYEDDANAKGIFKSTDGGKSWGRISNGLRVNPTTGQPHYVRDIAVHPTNPDIVLAATGWGLYKSTDGGANWVLQ